MNLTPSLIRGLLIGLLAPLFFCSTSHADSKAISATIKNVQVPPAILPANYAIAYSLYDPSKIYFKGISAKGTYSVVAPSGVYAVRTTAWFGSKVGYKTGIKIVKTPTLRRSTAAAIAGPDGTTVSVGNIKLLGSDGKVIRGQSGPVTLDASFTTAIVNAPKQCAIHVVEDPDFGRLSDVLKEAKLRSSDKVAPENRVDYDLVTSSLDAWKAQYRLTGTVTVTTVPGGTLSKFLGRRGTPLVVVSMQLIDLCSNTPIWSKTYSGKASDLRGSLARQISTDALSQLCDDFSGNWAGSILASSNSCVAHYDAGDVTFIGGNRTHFEGTEIFSKSGTIATMQSSHTDLFPASMSGTVSGSSATLQGQYSGYGLYFGSAELQMNGFHVNQYCHRETTGTYTITISSTSSGSAEENAALPCSITYSGTLVRSLVRK